MSSLITKIKKLRALAENNSNANEAAVAAAMADKLMRQHAITTADLDLGVLLSEDPLVCQSWQITSATWTAQLAWAIGAHCRVRVLRARSGQGTFARVYGHHSDVEIFCYLYDVARREVARAARLHKRERPWLTRTSMTAFREGAVYGLRKKLEEQRDAAAKAETGTELTLASRLARARAFSAAEEARKGCKVGTYSGGVGASASGVRAGRKINLNPGIAARQG